MLWAERAAGATAEAPPPAAAGAAAPHPFAADAADVAAALACVAEAPAAPTRLTVVLPSAAGRPLPSPRIAHLLGHTAHEGDDGGTTLAAWNVPAIAVGAADAARVLTALDDRDLDGAGAAGAGAPATPGPGVVFFAACARFARSLEADQRIVPTLTQRADGRLSALWQPWLSDDATATRLRGLLAAMPPAARAAVDAAEHDAWVIVEDFLWHVTDAAARRAMLGESMIEAIEGRPPSDPAVSWLGGLLGDARETPIAVEHRAAALRAVRQWLSMLDDVGAGALWRLLLVLEEPAGGVAVEDFAEPGEEVAWRLSFHLQAADSSRVRIDATRIWSLPGDTAVVEGRRLESPQEFLLQQLARAARICPVIDRALQESAPTELDLTTRQAYEFLRELRPLLIEQGFAVECPEWWDSPMSRFGARLHVDSEPIEVLGDASGPGVASAAGARVGLDTFVNYRWQIALGETALSLKEFERLAAQRAPLVRVRGQWVEIRQEDVRAAVKFIKENPGGKIRAAEAIRLAYAWDAEQTGMPITGVSATGWMSSLLGTAEESLPMLEQPREFHGALRPYQLRGVSWLSFLDRFGLGACLADDMGLGKTVQMLALLQQEREAAQAAGAERPGPTLIIVPMSVVGNWSREAGRFAPALRVLIHHGAERHSGEALREAARAADVTLTTYALAHRDRDELARVEWARVVLDEAQNIKNPGAKQSRAVRSFHAPRRVALTGTPVENRLSELWSIMDFCNPGLLGPAGEFRRRFAVPIERHHNHGRSRQLRALVQPFVLRRLKSDPTINADLPEKLESKEFCRLTPEQATLYEATVKRMLAEADKTEGIRRRGLVLAALVKLKQICNHPAQALREVEPGDTGPIDPARSGKAMRLCEMLEEVLAAGDNCLIFTQFREMGRLLSGLIAHQFDKEPLFLHGGVAQKARDALVERFQKADGASPVFIISLKAGGTGLNLTAANHVFHYDRWWNPAVENQATDRAHRIGQTRTVQVHKMVCAGTLEERIDTMIEQKTDLAQSIIGAGEQWLTELTTAQLRDLVSLGADALADDDAADAAPRRPRPDLAEALAAADAASDADWGTDE